MAIKFQYNKTSLGELGKQLKMRRTALPTIKSKESALRSEVKRAKDSAAEYLRRLDRLKGEYDYMAALWGEFDPTLVRIADVDLTVQKIAGVRTPVLGQVHFERKPYDLFSAPLWYADGVAVLERMAQLGLEYEVYRRKMELLDYARRGGYRSGPVFLTREGTPMSRTYVTISIRQLCRAARVPEEKGNPRCLKRLYQSTRAGIEANISLLVEQAHDRLLESEQSHIGWEGLG